MDYGDRGGTKKGREEGKGKDERMDGENRVGVNEKVGKTERRGGGREGDWCRPPSFSSYRSANELRETEFGFQNRF